MSHAAAAIRDAATVPHDVLQWTVSFEPLKPTCQGHFTGRSGHTATYVPQRNSVVIVNGLTDSGGGGPQAELCEYLVDEKRFELIHPSGVGPESCFGHTAALVNLGGKPALWIFGGLGCSNTHLNQSFLLVLEPGSEAWVNVPVSGISGRWGHSVVQRDDGTLLLFGGMLSDMVASSEIFSIKFDVCGLPFPVAQRILPKGGGPQGRRRHTAVLYRNNFMIVHGGRCAPRFFDDMWIFVVDINVWFPIASTMTGAALSSLYMLDTLVKKADYSTAQLALVNELIKQAYGATVATQHAPSHRTGHAAFIKGDFMFVHTGFQATMHLTPPMASFNDLYAYDILHNRWIVVKESTTPAESGNSGCLSEPRGQSMGTSTLLPDGTVLQAGGRNRDSAVDDAFIMRIRTPHPRLAEKTIEWVCRARLCTRLRDPSCAEHRELEEQIDKGLTERLQQQLKCYEGTSDAFVYSNTGAPLVKYEFKRRDEDAY